MIGKDEAREIETRLAALEPPVLSVYADTDPANPDNKGGAWRIRVKNALREIPELQESDHRDLHRDVMDLVDDERPTARTVALFAAKDARGKTLIERFDLQVSLPVVDLRRGRVEARWGEPYLEPLLFALDEYQRAAVLTVQGARWRLFEFFLGEHEELSDAFGEVDEREWQELREAAKFLRSGRLARELQPDRSGSVKDAAANKTEAWKRKLYRRLVGLVEKTLDARGIDRLVLVGDPAETATVASLFSGRYHRKIAALLPHPSDGSALDAAQVMEALTAAERRDEGRLLDEIREAPGLWGVDKVVEAIQLGRTQVVVVPVQTEARIAYVPDAGLYAGTKEAAAKYGEPVEVPLRDHIFRLAASFGARLEFVDGETAERVEREFDGIAALPRW